MGDSATHDNRVLEHHDIVMHEGCCPARGPRPFPLAPRREGREAGDTRLTVCADDGVFLAVTTRSYKSLCIFNPTFRLAGRPGRLEDGTTGVYGFESYLENVAFRTDDGRDLTIDFNEVASLWIEPLPSPEQVARNLIAFCMAQNPCAREVAAGSVVTTYHLGRLTGNPSDVIRVHGVNAERRHVELEGRGAFELDQDKKVDFFRLLYEVEEGLSGDEFETEGTCAGESLQPASFWETEYSMEDARAYIQIIRPKVLGALQRLMAHWPHPGTQAVDLLGGDSHFARGVRTLAETAGIHLDVSVLDRSNRSAEKCLQAEPPLRHIQCDINRDDLVSLLPADLGLVTCLGGLTSQVVTIDTAHRASCEVFEALNPGGYFILSGRTPIHLNAADFREIGFEVLNMRAHSNREFNMHCIPLYALRKPL